MSIVLDIYVLSCLQCFILLYSVQPLCCNINKHMLLLLLLLMSSCSRKCGRKPISVLALGIGIDRTQ